MIEEQIHFLEPLCKQILAVDDTAEKLEIVAKAAAPLTLCSLQNCWLSFWETTMFPVNM